MKRIVSVVIAVLILALSVMPYLSLEMMNVKAAENDYKCGDNATWSLDSKTGVLKIEGTGKLYSYTTEQAPWRKYNQYIKSMIIDEGITYIGNGAFTMLNNLVSLSLPSSLEEIWADASLPLLETLTIPENSNLKFVNYVNFASNSKWYASIPDKSAVYIGSFLLGFKGTADENTSVAVADGTKAINKNAFKSIENIMQISFPETVDYIGVDAFYGTGWYNSLPDGAVYAGKVLYSYKGTMPFDEADFVVKDGTVYITEKVFYDNGILNSVTIPVSLEAVGTQAFDNCSNLNTINFSESGNLKVIGKNAFSDTAVEEIEFPESLEVLSRGSFSHTKLVSVYIPKNITMLDGAFGSISALENFEVSPDNPNYCSEDGILFSKDKKTLHYFPSQRDDYEYVVPDCVEYIGESAFSFSDVKRLVIGKNVKSMGGTPFYRSYIRSIILNESLPVLNKYMFYDNWGTHYLTIPESVKTVESGALGYHLDYVYFKGKDVTFADAKWFYSQKVKIFCYEDSTVYEFAQANSEKLTAIILDDENIGDYDDYEYTVNKFRSLSSERKSHYAYGHASAVIDNIPLNISKDYQSEIDAATENLNNELNKIGVVWSDYSAVDEAISRAVAIDRTLFTEESLKRVDDAVNSVKRYCDVADEKLINEYVRNIDNAITLLAEKVGDYSQLNKVLGNAKNINRVLYTDETLAALDEAVYEAENAEITENQDVINSYAKAIEDAISKLSYKPADFSEIESVMLTVNSIDRRLYTEESLAELDKKVAEIDYNLTVDNQSKVTQWASEIETAVKNLKYLPADYSAVEREIEKARKIDRRFYSEISLIALDAAINSVNYNLDITRQQEVDAFASAIADAVSALQYASIVLRHEACGVVVSATTKEIKPDTVLAVEEVDPSNYEGTNFAVGGSIRSLSFYDINLVYETVIVQPDGTVTVKIKLKDGVDPLKCKVYHVTEDVVNPLVRFANTIDGNYVVFETNHFSEFAVIEVETVLDSIEILSTPNRTEYFAEETLDLSGLKVVAHYSDGTSCEVSDYNVGMVDMNTVGNKNVTVYYTFGAITKTVSFEIVVSNRTYSDKEFLLREPSIAQINYGESIWLHVNFDGVLPGGTKIIWTQSNDNFEIVEISENGMSCKITPASSGETVFTVSLVDENGMVLATDTQAMTSKAGVWQKIVAFFKKLFGITKTYLQEYEKVF